MKKTILLMMSVLLIISMVGSASAFDLEILNTDPAPVVAGDYADITVQISEDTARETYKDVSITLVESDDVKIVGDPIETVGRLSYAESVTRTFRVFFDESVPGGNVKLDFIVNSDKLDQEFTAQVFVSDSASLPDLRIGQIESVPDELLEDTDDNKITVTLQNLGETKAELITAELKYNGNRIRPSTSFSLIDSLASIDAGEEGELEFEFDILEGVKTDIPVNVELRYRSRQSVSDTYRVFEETIRTILPLAESPFLEITNVEDNHLKTGSVGNKVTVTVKNTGTKTADDVRIRMHPDISYPFVFDFTTHYITSELEPDEEVTYQFEVEATRRGTTRAYPITVELESLVGETLYSREDTLILDVEEVRSTDNRTIGMGIIGLVVLIAIIFTIYNKIKGRKKKKK